ncbi:MAG: GIY-YIG nuclease family protein [Thaumarchaeota archaeon]|jgi:excinuclease UvrABC nuclease subunit|nr:GIY-YIG nuclease family protein [Nitrososphaerota archaeon]MBT5843185.1 GIY-YIG nuclease family protein [Nitrososphaerota archaeon]MBT6469336.1 GIY-YIG nuclease family protein [Nitrososphaerota archaeon]
MELLEDKMRVWLENAKFVKPVPGVYVLYNRKKDPIYIGYSKNLETTFSKYVDSEFEENECKQKTQYYQREFMEDPESRQEQLIEEFKRNTGNPPTCNSEIKVQTT